MCTSLSRHQSEHTSQSQTLQGNRKHYQEYAAEECEQARETDEQEDNDEGSDRKQENRLRAM